jgi:hypothetical protein
MDNQMPSVKELIDRPFRYFYDDGLVELAVGTLFLAAGLTISAWAATPAGSMWRLVGALLLVAIPLLGSVLFKCLVQKVKDHWVHPRTGYVDYGESRPSRARWIVIGGALALAIAGFVLPDRLNNMALGEGALLGLVLATLAYRARLTRFYLLAAIAALIGLAAALWLGPDLWGSAATFGATGAVMILSGGCALRQYFMAHPAQSAQGDRA